MYITKLRTRQTSMPMACSGQNMCPRGLDEDVSSHTATSGGYKSLFFGLLIMIERRRQNILGVKPRTPVALELQGLLPAIIVTQPISQKLAPECRRLSFRHAISSALEDLLGMVTTSG